MKKVLLIALVLVVLSAPSIFARISTWGVALQPIGAINVSLEHKRLIITLRGSYFQVEAYLELYNHEGAVIEPSLGLEFREGWSWGHFNLQENMQRFVLTVNNEAQRFEHQHRFEGEEANTVGIHTLVYRARLNPGRNAVYYEFQMPYGAFAIVSQVFYVLRTNGRWKNDILRDFEIVIKAEGNHIVRFFNYPQGFRAPVILLLPEAKADFFPARQARAMTNLYSLPMVTYMRIYKISPSTEIFIFI